jgi:dipeptidyl aminopeptidase/acylaminoacyl peptidase
MRGEKMKTAVLRWILLFCGLSSATNAAPKNAPLIVYASSGLWGWDGAWKRLTPAGEYNYSKALSPDGSKLAYVTDGIDSSKPFDADKTKNVPFRAYVLELQSGKVRPLKGLLLKQPSAVPRLEEVGLIAWSPDGTRLAWMSPPAEATIDSNWNMMVYTFSSGKTQHFKLSGIAAPEDTVDRQLVWTGRGLRVWIQTTPWKKPSRNAVRWYSPSGKLLALEGPEIAKPYAPHPRYVLRCPTDPNKRCSLQDGAGAPLDLGLDGVDAVTSSDGSRVVLRGYTPRRVTINWLLQTETTQPKLQMWLYESGKLTQMEIPPEFSRGVQLTWYSEIHVPYEGPKRRR